VGVRQSGPGIGVEVGVEVERSCTWNSLKARPARGH